MGEALSEELDEAAEDEATGEAPEEETVAAPLESPEWMPEAVPEEVTSRAAFVAWYLAAISKKLHFYARLNVPPRSEWERPQGSSPYFDARRGGLAKALKESVLHFATPHNVGDSDTAEPLGSGPGKSICGAASVEGSNDDPESMDIDPFTATQLDMIGVLADALDVADMGLELIFGAKGKDLSARKDSISTLYQTAPAVHIISCYAGVWSEAVEVEISDLDSISLNPFMGIGTVRIKRE